MIINQCDVCGYTTKKDSVFHPNCTVGYEIIDLCDHCYNEITEAIKDAAQGAIENIRQKYGYIKPEPVEEEPNAIEVQSE